jgi:hypothetical protein
MRSNEAPAGRWKAAHYAAFAQERLSVAMATAERDSLRIHQQQNGQSTARLAAIKLF